MNKSKLFSILGLISLLMLSIPSSAQESDRTDAYEDAPCPVDIPVGFTAGDGILGVECGFVTVPESRAEPDGRQIRLAVAVIHSASPSPAPDPLLFAQGGPGGSTIDLFLPAAPLFLPFLNQRDIVLVEQRGTLYSEPNLNCTELTDLAIEFIADFNSDAYEAAEDIAYNDCFGRVTADGTNLSNFNSVENAADMVDAADALGYTGDINFYGVSYGTLLGQHLLRDHEDRIRSIIFDAVAPTNLNFLTDVTNTAQNANDVLFAACAADDLCNALYPNLEDTLFATVAELNDNPATISIIDPETDITYETLFYGDSLLALIRQLQYTTEFVPALPYFIQASSEGDFGWAERLGGVVFIDAGRTIADAMFISVMCAEDGDYTQADINTDTAREEIVELYSELALSVLDGCASANITPLDNYVDDPIVSDVPSLITSGEFDPITPSSYADMLANSLTNDTNLTFPGVGHGALLGGQCPLGIMVDFVADPTAELDTNCIQDMGVSFAEFTTDPTGQLVLPRLPDFEDASGENFARYENSDTNIAISVIAVSEADADSVDSAITTALTTIVDEDFDRPVLIEQTIEDGLGTFTQKAYQNGANFVFALGQQQRDTYIIILLEFPPLQLNAVDPLLAPILVNTFLASE